MKRIHVILLLAAVAVSACGKPAAPPPSPAAQAPPMSGNDADQAFLQAMVPHHEMAIEMAKMAKEKAKNPTILAMSADIIRTQSEEIKRMKTIHQRLFSSELEPDMMAHERLGLSMEESGMTMDMRMKEAAPGFDKMFAGEMAKHHQGAINMARKVLEKSQDVEVRSLAEAIIDAQTKEIEVLRKI